MTEVLPNIVAVTALPGHRLDVRWRDGTRNVVEMLDVLTSHPAFEVLLDEREFAKVSVVDWGGGIEWNNGADYAADALHSLVSRQRGLLITGISG